MSKTLSDVSLLDLLPDSVSSDANAHAAALGVDSVLHEVALSVDVPSIYANVDQRTGAQLDHLAFGWDANVWRDAWPEELKRSVIKNVVVEKRKRGTLLAVKEAIASIGSAATIVEWWQEIPKATPHTFKISATLSKIEGVLDSEMQEDLMHLIDGAKPVRSHYTLELVRNLPGSIGLVGQMRIVSHARLTALSLLANEYKGEMRVSSRARLISYARVSAIS